MVAVLPVLSVRAIASHDRWSVLASENAGMKLSPLHIRVHKAIQLHRLMPKGCRILLGVSGGQDSLCLMHLLNDLTVLWDWQLFVLHCNHRWVKRELDCANFVIQQAQKLQLTCDVATAPRIYRDEKRARQWRYQMFLDWGKQWDCPYVATAHTGSDRAETFLFNLMRGSGADGLSSLKWRRPLVANHPDAPWLVRPLLELWRQETADFCDRYAIPIWEDPFNQDLSHPRNRIRHELIPLLKQHFNPQVELTLNRTSDILSNQAEDIAKRANALWSQVYRENPPRLDRVQLGQASIAVQREVIRHFFQTHLQSPNFEQVEILRALINAPRRSKSPSLHGGAWAENQENFLVLRNIAETK